MLSRSTIAIGLAALCLPMMARAQTATLDDAQLDALLTGNTLYIAVPSGPAGGPDGGIAPFVYGADGSASARLPAGMTLVGIWSIEDGQYCVDWDNGPKGSCTSIRKTGDAIELYDTGADEVRGTVESIVPGNPENL